MGIDLSDLRKTISAQERANRLVMIEAKERREQANADRNAALGALELLKEVEERLDGAAAAQAAEIAEINAKLAAAEAINALQTKALNALALALADENHTWTPEERALYDAAFFTPAPEAPAP